MIDYYLMDIAAPAFGSVVCILSFLGTFDIPYIDIELSISAQLVRDAVKKIRALRCTSIMPLLGRLDMRTRRK